MVEELASSLQSIAGDALRSVATYSTDDYEVLFLRDDVDDSYTDVDLDVIHEELTLNGMSKQHLESLFSAGELSCSTYHFEEATVYHFSDEGEGLFVSVDQHAAFPISRLLDRCRDYLVG